MIEASAMGETDWDSSRGMAVCVYTGKTVLTLASNHPLRTVAQVPILIQSNALRDKLDSDNDDVPRLYVVRFVQHELSSTQEIFEDPVFLTCECSVSPWSNATKGGRVTFSFPRPQNVISLFHPHKRLIDPELSQREEVYAKSSAITFSTLDD